MPEVGAAPLILDAVKRDAEVVAYIEKANEYTGAIGYTEHGFRHAGLVSAISHNILKRLGYGDRPAQREVGADGRDRRARLGRRSRNLGRRIPGRLRRLRRRPLRRHVQRPGGRAVAHRTLAPGPGALGTRRGLLPRAQLGALIWRR